MKMKRPLAATVGFALLVPLAACFPQEPDAVKTRSAAQWLIGKQHVGGDFELVGYPNGETENAIFALAATAQTGPSFDVDQARQRIEAIKSSYGKTALDYLESKIDNVTVPPDWAAFQAAQVAALVAEPLGIDPTDFDPSNDSADPVNLIARFEQFQQSDGTFSGFRFKGALYAAIALAKHGDEVPANRIAQIVDAQRPDGSWNSAGTQDVPSDAESDIFTTSLALLALSTSGIPISDDTVDAGIAYLASVQEDDGSFYDDPSVTSLVAVALSDLHLDVTTPQWRADYDSPVPDNSTYTSPYAWLGSRQAADGHIAGMYGFDGYETSTSIQALSRQWFLADDHAAVSGSLAEDLTTNGGGDASATSVQLVSDAIGPNVSIDAARVRAANAAVNSAAGREAAVDALFQQALRRSVDPSGRAFYADQLTRTDRPTVLVGLLSSPEFTNTHGPSAGAFVDGLYQVLFGRAADAAGRNYWVGRVNAGMSRASVAQVFVAGGEYRSDSVVDSYNLMLGGDPDHDELDAGVGLLANDRIETLLGQLGGSEEYYDGVTGFGDQTAARPAARTAARSGVRPWLAQRSRH